ncbi:MAG: recombinase RecA [Methylophagaceae bacterium]
MSDFFRALVEDIKDEDTVIAADGLGSAEYTGSVDTGSYMLNAVLSGSIFGGVPNNKISAFAGESATGKTFFVLGIVQKNLTDTPSAGVVYYDTEAAVTKEMMESRGIDTTRVIIAEPDTIQAFRHHALRMIESYSKNPVDRRPPMMFVLDSLGLLSTTKEMEDTAEGKETRDMTKSQIIKATFRVLTLKLAKVKVPMLVTNHVYDVIGSYVPMKEIGGGSGLKYAASTICMLGKKKDKEGTDVVGNIIKCTTHKSRLSKENKKVEVKLSYETGLDRYYGLLDLAEKYGLVKKVSTRVEMPDGSKVYAKAVYSNPEKYFTDEFLAKLDAAAKKEYSYGSELDEELIPDTDVTGTDES